jgi:hypothetical protein
MNVTPAQLRTSLLTLAALAAGYAAGRPARTVEAQSSSHSSHSSSSATADEPLTFQFSEMNNQTAFTVYNAAEHTLYVYQGLTSSGSHMNCTFTLHLSRLGGPVERQNCAPGSPF